MKRIIPIFTILILFAVPAYALLEDYGDGTVGQLRNDGSKLMWWKDANTAFTSGYDADGLISITRANLWLEDLNSSNYLGYNDWRLPYTLPVNGSTHDYTWSFDGSTDTGYNISAPGSAYPGSTGSEMAYMFYTELGNLGTYDVSGNGPQTDGVLANPGPFTNLQSDLYHSVTSASNNKAWAFNFGDGYQVEGGGFEINAWAVRDCPSCTVVPEPISSILFITGGGVLAGRRYFRGRK